MVQVMNAVPFDTLKLARDLEAAGLAPPVAAGTAAALAGAMATSEFATKTDLVLLESRILAAIGAGDANLSDEIREVDTKLSGEMRELDTKLSGRLTSFEAKTETRFAALDTKLELLRRDMTIKLGGMMIVAVGVLLTAMRFMPHP
jgi:hypothetical protein